MGENLHTICFLWEFHHKNKQLDSLHSSTISSVKSSGITTNDARERHELKKQPHQQVTAKAAGKQTGDTSWQGKAVKVLVPVPMETWPEPSSHRTEFARVS